MSERKQSAWQRKGKSSFVYSGIYSEWKREAKANGAGSPRALELSCLHAKANRVRHNLADGEKANDCASPGHSWPKW